MTWTVIIFAALCAFALAGWTLAELENRDLTRDLEQAEHDRDVALGWAETQEAGGGVVQPTLSVIEGGDAS